MTSATDTPRYKMVNVRPGHVIIEHEQRGQRARAYFSDEPVPPIEEYREGNTIWTYSGTAQSFQFDVLDQKTGETISFKELLGLLYSGCAKEGSPIRAMGAIAEENRISTYLAVTYENADGGRSLLAPEKVRVLNRLFNERLRTPGKKILILPDLFDLYRSMSYGEIMLDFGLTSMEPEAH
jgi:hypothetical protein